MATPVTRGGSIPRVARSVWMNTPYSSAVCSRLVVSRHETRSREPSKTPTLVLVLPTSITSSMAPLHGHVSREHTEGLAAVRAEHERAVAPEVHRHAFPSVRRPRAAPDTLRPLEPRFSDAVQAGGEEPSIPPIEGRKHALKNLADGRHPSRLDADGGREIAQRRGKLGLIDVEADAEDDVAERARPWRRRLRQHAADLPLSHHHVVGPADGGAHSRTRPERVSHRHGTHQGELGRAIRRHGRTEDYGHEQARALGGARLGQPHRLGLCRIDDAQRVDAVAEAAGGFGQAHWSAVRLALSLARICCCSSRRPRSRATTSPGARSTKSGRLSFPSRKAISLRARSISLPSRARSAPRSTTPSRWTYTSMPEATTWADWGGRVACALTVTRARASAAMRERAASSA